MLLSLSGGVGLCPRSGYILVNNLGLINILFVFEGVKEDSVIKSLWRRKRRKKGVVNVFLILC